MITKQVCISLVALFAAMSTLGGCVAADVDDGDPIDEDGEVAEGLSFSGCSSAQTTKINQHIADALQKTKKSFSYLGTDSKSQKRFNQYFGPRTSAAQSQVTAMLKQIRNKLKNKSFAVSCNFAQNNCGPGVVARGGDDHLDLCPPYFAGSDADAGATVVHEVSHMLGTDDTGCGPKHLPEALNGAYCYEGFVYNDLWGRWDND